MNSNKIEMSHDDEVLEIKRVMKIASARQMALSSLTTKNNIKAFTTSNNNDNNVDTYTSTNCNSCKKLKEELIQCNSTIDSLRRELRESNYNLQVIKDKERYSKDNDNMELIKNKAIIISLKQSIENLEKDRTMRDKELCNELDTITRQLTRLEKHTLQGHHPSSSLPMTSKVTVNLLVNIKNGIDSLKNNYLYGNKLGDDPNIAKLTNINNNNNNNSVADPLDSALLDMCKHLEDENSKLHQTIQSVNEDLQLAQRESSLGKLIPHYRLAIVRCKAQLSHAREQLKTEQQCSKLLRIQLEEVYNQFDIKKISKDNNSTSNKEKSNEKKEKYNSSNNDNKKKLINEDIDTYNDLNKEIIDLDAEIDVLREQLEQAALSHTQKILTGVIEKSTVSDATKININNSIQ